MNIPISPVDPFAFEENNQEVKKKSLPTLKTLTLRQQEFQTSNLQKIVSNSDNLREDLEKIVSKFNLLTPDERKKTILNVLNLNKDLIPKFFILNDKEFTLILTPEEEK